MKGFSHAPITPKATYSPWLDDAEFSRIYKLVRPNTIVDQYRSYELWGLVEQTIKLPGDILEVGVWRGGTGCLIAKRAQMLGSSATVFLCDTFAGVVKAGERDPHYRGGEHADASAGIVRQLIADLDLSNAAILEGIFPDDTGSLVAERHFSLCHIDVDVYESARDVLEWVWPRLAVGGAIVYDDYGFVSCQGITRLVNERVGRPGSLTLHNLNGHAVVIKIS
ncbi:MAG TPA: TylF/MycF/NovP-related O-methyltransferase [Stellaceae bacterium]|jgi:O-methyltransferase